MNYSGENVGAHKFFPLEFVYNIDENWVNVFDIDVLMDDGGQLGSVYFEFCEVGEDVSW
jgi:hypothetical protein